VSGPVGLPPAKHNIRVSKRNLEQRFICMLSYPKFWSVKIFILILKAEKFRRFRRNFGREATLKYLILVPRGNRFKFYYFLLCFFLFYSFFYIYFNVFFLFILVLFRIFFLLLINLFFFSHQMQKLRIMTK